ncbi:hypothetical protein GCM10011375_40970 [Hymenobacter qilianensis]|uniref:Uncharacterized protein n=1 Tax=Hymenobacter qilianensis TaxID=1385715 RepID=A0ACB5PXG1_9BACT|nr:hypothetical protein GCM10011375_40970 [Hymenobacter qilianensis]
MGTVLDEATGLPVRPVLMAKKNTNSDQITTDSAGRFTLSSIAGGWRCPQVTLVVEARPYQPVEISMPAGGKQMIYLSSLSRRLPKGSVKHLN